MARYIFITGGVVSSLGKGLMAASLAALLQARGYKVRIRKFDPYLNVDPGTMSPYQHGEVYVTDDGAETDLDLGLKGFPNDCFDYVILEETLQTLKRPDVILQEMRRVGYRGIVTFPNFGYWRVRLDLAVRGQMPVTEWLPHRWYETPNIHLCTLRDFTALCEDLELRIDACASLVPGKPARQIDPMAPIENWRAENALFLLSRKAEPAPPSTPAPPPGDLFE